MELISRLLAVGILAAVIIQCNADSQECEVCITYLNKLIATLSKEEKSDPKKIEAKFKELCKTSKNRENTFCYYLGGNEDSATGILSEMSKPISYGMPADKVCLQKLKKKDAQICDLKYEKKIDLSKIKDLKTLKVRDLKKILSDWNEVCEDCLEKGDYVKYIEKVKAKYMKTEL